MPSPTRIGSRAMSTNDMTSTYGTGGMIGAGLPDYRLSGHRHVSDLLAHANCV